MSTPLDLSSSQSVPKQLKKLLKDSRLFLHGTSYQYSAALSTSHSIVFTQVIKGEPVFSHEGRIRLRLNAARTKVVGYTPGYLKEERVLRRPVRDDQSGPGGHLVVPPQRNS
ncbi:two-component system regulatory protein YycI [Limosilactobacillus fermentum]